MMRIPNTFPIFDNNRLFLMNRLLILALSVFCLCLSCGKGEEEPITDPLGEKAGKILSEKVGQGFELEDHNYLMNGLNYVAVGWKAEELLLVVHDRSLKILSQVSLETGLSRDDVRSVRISHLRSTFEVDEGKYYISLEYTTSSALLRQSVKIEGSAVLSSTVVRQSVPDARFWYKGYYTINSGMTYSCYSFEGDLIFTSEGIPGAAVSPTEAVSFSEIGNDMFIFRKNLATGETVWSYSCGVDLSSYSYSMEQSTKDIKGNLWTFVLKVRNGQMEEITYNITIDIDTGKRV